MMLRPVHPADHLLLLAGERELSPRQSARIDRHVAQCDACRQRRARLQSAIADLHDDNGAARTCANTDLAVLRGRLQKALRAQADMASPRRPRPMAPALETMVHPLAVAAGILLAVFVLQAVNRGATMTRTLDRPATPLPLASITPGAVSSLTADALCAGERPPRVVSLDVRDQVLADYSMRGAPSEAYELDALVTPELGGTVARANLWPQRYDATWNAHVKDALENLLATRVCAGATSLAIAQRALADDWIAAYRTYFQTELPIATHVASLEADDDLLLEELPPRVGERPRPSAPAVMDARRSRGLSRTPHAAFMHQALGQPTLRLVAMPAIESAPLPTGASRRDRHM